VLARKVGGYAIFGLDGSKAIEMATNPPAASDNFPSTGDGHAVADSPAPSGKSESNRVVTLNFRVSGDFKKAFKIAAATHGVTQSDLLQQAFDEWRQRRG
jgi:hypothetical protein